MSEIELVCIKLGESALFGEKKVWKNAPLGPLRPPSKLWRVRSSFELGGAFEKSLPPPSSPLGPRFGCFVD